MTITKKNTLLAAILMALAAMFSFSSCEKEPVTPDPQPGTEVPQQEDNTLLYDGQEIPLTSVYHERSLGSESLLFVSGSFMEPDFSVELDGDDLLSPGTYSIPSEVAGNIVVSRGEEEYELASGTLTITASANGPCYQLQATDEAGHSLSLRSSLAVTTLNNTGTGQFTLAGETYSINSAMQVTMLVSGFPMTQLLFTDDEATYAINLLRVFSGFEPGTYELGDESAILTHVVAMVMLGDDEAGESLSGTLTVAASGDTYTFTLAAETTLGPLEMTYTGRVATLAKKPRSKAHLTRLFSYLYGL